MLEATRQLRAKEGVVVMWWRSTVVWIVVLVVSGLSSGTQAWSIDGGGQAWEVNSGREAWRGHGNGRGTADGDTSIGADWNVYDLSIHVLKQQRQLVLRQGDQVVQTFPVVLGRQPVGAKEYRGDNRTPEGTYYIAEKRANSRFHRFLGISYPNREDAERGFAQRLINANEWADIFFANLRKLMPPASTLLGGRVGIHGHAGRKELAYDWTEGCIAVTDPAIEYLYELVPVGTPVYISN
jgi:lipoprotein-anchoring transpeptidase ErfK/SrfK